MVIGYLSNGNFANVIFHSVVIPEGEEKVTTHTCLSLGGGGGGNLKGKCMSDG